MVRLAALPESDRENMLKKIPTLPRFPQRHWARGPKLVAHPLQDGERRQR